MNIELSPETRAWLQSEISAGNFRDEGEAIDALVRLHLQSGLPDPDWIRPHLEAAERDVAAGRLFEQNALDARLSSSRARRMAQPS